VIDADREVERFFRVNYGASVLPDQFDFRDGVIDDCEQIIEAVDMHILAHNETD